MRSFSAIWIRLLFLVGYSLVVLIANYATCHVERAKHLYFYL